MRLRTARGKPALLCYCANVHPGETLDDVRAALHRYARPIREALGVPQMGVGLWLSRGALDQLHEEGPTGLDRLRDGLAEDGLFVFTMNGFPYGNFQADVVKRDVYHPDWSTRQRQRYLVELAETLAALMPDDISDGTISTLPIAHREEAGSDIWPQALEQICELADDLARLRQQTGKSIRVCFEPEPGCLLETTSDAVKMFQDRLPAIARRRNMAPDVIASHLGVCFDTCHQAVAFEDAAVSLGALRAAGVTVGKIQLASALVVHEPDSPAGRAALTRFDEPRFLHQVRAQLDDGALGAVDDLPAALAVPRPIPADRPWRVHFHVPIHRDLVGELGTTRSFLRDTLAAVADWDVLPHLEIETYTWSVLPPGERPVDDDGLVAGIADELRWVRKELT
ncbi:MAG TPA: metabolite traffic protein EboE [Polyangia bacterium]|jgi:sugar phosphate isomerase/epimerase|nr:metabolite traffic protein EboE [Polyangia bacterium]